MDDCTYRISVGQVLHWHKHHDPQRKLSGAQIAQNNSNQTGIHSN